MSFSVGRPKKTCVYTFFNRLLGRIYTAESRGNLLSSE